jgi:hypothetical protein
MGSLVGRQDLYILTAGASQPACYENPTLRRDFGLQLPILWSFPQIPAADHTISKARHDADTKARRNLQFTEFSEEGLPTSALVQWRALNIAISIARYQTDQTTLTKCLITREWTSRFEDHSPARRSPARYQAVKLARIAPALAKSVQTRCPATSRSAGSWRPTPPPESSTPSGCRRLAARRLP